MNRIRLDAIVFDAGTQIRAAIDQHVVCDYAEAMTNGATFPPIVLFHDGNQHYLADGFHRFMAAQRNQWREIEADVQPGTKEDALWYALGANRLNGSRLTLTDKRHAIKLAVAMWPNKTQAEIAGQVGCSQQFVSQVTATCKVQRDANPYSKISAEKATAVERLLREGKSVRQVSAALKASVHTVARIRDEHGIARRLDNTRDGIQDRHERIRGMAKDGYSSRQIAADLGISDQRVRELARRLGVEIAADKAIGHAKRHDSNRIVEQIVADAENLTEGINLIDFSDIDRERLGDWIDSLIASRRGLDAFIKRLTKEKTRDGQAA